MSFLPSTKREVQPDGDPTSNICIIGDIPGAIELNTNKLLSGFTGTILEQCLHNAKLIRGEVYITSAVRFKSSANTLYNERTKRLTEVGLEAREALLEELKGVDANIFVTLGNIPTAMLVGQGGIMTERGYISLQDSVNRRKVLPTVHPGMAMRGNYVYRHFITADLRKAVANSKTRELKFPECTINIPTTADEAVAMLHHINEQAKVVSVDIEVYNYECSCIGFSYEENIAYVIPLYFDKEKRWSVLDEVKVWKALALVLENPELAKIGQNFIFDMQFLLQRNRILTRGYIHDTMIKSACCFPDFPKSLGFLVSVHCNRPQWKDMVKWKGSDLVKKDN